MAEKLSAKVLKNWIKLCKRGGARSVAKIRPIKASGPLLIHHLLSKANLPARMEIIRYLLVFTGIYQKHFLVVKTPFWTEPQRGELRYSELPAANGRDGAFTLVYPKQEFEGAGEGGNLPFSGRRGKGLFFLHMPFQMLKLCPCAEPKRPSKVSCKMQMFLLPLPKLWTRVSRCALRGQ